MLSRFVTIFLIALCWAQPMYAASSKEGVLQFQIPIEQGAQKYLELLEYPAYLVVALENNGIRTSNTRPILMDVRTIKLNSTMLRFAERKNGVYTYKTSVEFDIPLKHLKFELPVEIDTSFISKGNIRVSVFLPLVNFIPDALVERIRMKIQSLSGHEVQKLMLGYFDDLSKKTESTAGLEGLFSKIMLQSYSVSVDAGGGCTLREPGDAESLSDQAYLLATLVIWLIIAPASFALFFIWRSRKTKRVVL